MQRKFSASFQQMMYDNWNANPLQSPYTPWIAINEGPSVLLSALLYIAPEYQLNIQEDTVSSLMAAVIAARPRWFPADDEWKRNAYAMIKMRLIEHEVPLDSVDFLDVSDWMYHQGLEQASLQDIYEELYAL